MKKQKTKLLVGITGGIGSGKTFVCNKLSKKGFKVFYADTIAKNLYASNKTLLKNIVKEFGEGILNYQGKINLSKLREVIFANKKNYAKINKIVHPLVIDYIIKESKKSIYDIVLVESALVFESGLDKDLDYIIMIYANKKTRVERIMIRDGAKKSEVENIMKYQIDDKQKLELSDFVLVNNKSEEQLDEQIDFLARLLKSLSKQKELYPEEKES
ncbi:MAG: dephospho-CoA kinase [Bacteroidetes bacterium]|nr:dephospho-CoA kinase [Bacteroidota bacterium]MBX7045208.1 dephospho-CoA kinase [Ignavibacteria bacterium]